VDSIFGESAFPGTVENRLVITFEFGVPGSTLKFQTGSNEVGWTTHTYEVPPEEFFQPVYFD
jgi:hypothetical protein